MSARYIITYHGSPLYVGYCKNNQKDMGWLGYGVLSQTATMRLKTANKIKQILIKSSKHGTYTNRSVIITKLDDSTELGRKIIQSKIK